MLIWNKDEENILTVDLNTYGIYGKKDNFTLYYKYKDDDKLTKSNVSFDEVLEDIGDGTSCKVQEDSAGKEIKVDDVSNLDIGMRMKVKDKDTYLYIEDLDTDNNIIYTRYKVKVNKDDELNQVGNTGIYQAKLKFSTVGKIILLVRNVKDKIDFNATHLTVTDFYNDVRNKIQTLYNIDMCKMEIKDNKLKYYDENDNEIASFKLYDEDGNATETDVYKRVPE